MHALLPALLLLGSAQDVESLRARVREFQPQARSPKDVDLAPRVRALLAGPPPEGWRPTGIDRRFYLDVAERVVREAAAWVDGEGRLIDPVLEKEFAQSTPR